mmetsp:Transcript_4544/g.12877  ORF Transcript_4544/g.12877 Transcript_4544/m.12877 type:complete len:204 (+) Transcript_4544:380-991(+)
MHDFVDEHPVAVKVDFLVILAVGRHLRCHPMRRADVRRHCGVTRRRLQPREAEVGDLRRREVVGSMDGALQQQVQRFQVAVDDRGVEAVQVGHGLGDVIAHPQLLQPAHRDVPGVVQQAEDAAADAQLADDFHRIHGHAPVHPDNVGVVDTLQDGELSAKARARLATHSPEVILHHLDRDGASLPSARVDEGRGAAADALADD